MCIMPSAMVIAPRTRFNERSSLAKDKSPIPVRRYTRKIPKEKKTMNFMTSRFFSVFDSIIAAMKATTAKRHGFAPAINPARNTVNKVRATEILMIAVFETALFSAPPLR